MPFLERPTKSCRQLCSSPCGKSPGHAKLVSTNCRQTTPGYSRCQSQIFALIDSNRCATARIRAQRSHRFSNATGERSALAGSIVSRTCALEDNLQGQLHVERFARPNARRSVIVANRVTGLSKAASKPAARLIRLKRLYISIRNWVLIRSVIIVFFTTEKSTDAKLGP
jgi:hypothetical protein